MTNGGFDEITEAEIEEIWQRERTEDHEDIRPDCKYVWETAKRVCECIKAHEDIIHITSFGEYRCMKKVMKVIKEAQNVEGKRRKTTRLKITEEESKRTQRAKVLIAEIRSEEIHNEEIEWRTEALFGNEIGQEIRNASSG